MSVCQPGYLSVNLTIYLSMCWVWGVWCELWRNEPVQFISGILLLLLSFPLLLSPFLLPYLFSYSPFLLYPFPFLLSPFLLPFPFLYSPLLLSTFPLLLPPFSSLPLLIFSSSPFLFSFPPFLFSYPPFFFPTSSYILLFSSPPFLNSPIPLSSFPLSFPFLYSPLPHSSPLPFSLPFLYSSLPLSLLPFPSSHSLSSFLSPSILL